MCLSHGKYVRNALLYNLGFVVQVSEGPIQCEYLLLEAFEDVLVKLSTYFATLEIESEFLSRHRQHYELLHSHSSNFDATVSSSGLELTAVGVEKTFNDAIGSDISPPPSALSKLLMSNNNSGTSTSTSTSLPSLREHRKTITPSLSTILTTLLTDLNMHAVASIPVGSCPVPLPLSLSLPPSLLLHSFSSMYS